MAPINKGRVAKGLARDSDNSEAAGLPDKKVRINKLAYKICKANPPDKCWRGGFCNVRLHSWIEPTRAFKLTGLALEFWALEFWANCMVSNCISDFIAVD